MPISTSILKYLKRCSHKPVESVCKTEPLRIAWICMPVCDELEELPDTLAKLAKALPEDTVNVMLCVNNSPDAAPERKNANQTLLSMLRGGWTGGLSADSLFWLDAASTGNELTRGVGEARKTAMDAALQLIADACVRLEENTGTDASHFLSNALIVCLDADSHVAPDYWNEITAAHAAHPEAGGFSLGFRHRTAATRENEDAIRLYERYMQEYVDGLAFAGSPYAYHSIGSAMAVTAECYAACGGMRMPRAGEDFYFLEAIAKVRPVIQLKTPIVFPSPRQSNRVFFGTGPMMTSLLHGGTLAFFNQRRFQELKQLLEAASDEQRLKNAPKEFLNSLPDSMRDFLSANRFSESWEKIRHNLSARPGAVRHAFDIWFDALKTYQYAKSAARKQ